MKLQTHDNGMYIDIDTEGECRTVETHVVGQHITTLNRTDKRATVSLWFAPEGQSVSFGIHPDSNLVVMYVHGDDSDVLGTITLRMSPAEFAAKVNSAIDMVGA